MKDLKKFALSLSLILTLSGCLGINEPLPPEVLSSQVIIAVTTLQTATVVLTANKLFVIDGVYQTIVNGENIKLKAGNAVDLNTYKLYSFDVEEFVNLYKAEHPELVR